MAPPSIKQLMLPTFPHLASAPGKRAIVTDRLCLSLGLLFSLYAILEVASAQLEMAMLDALFASLVFFCIWLNRRGRQPLAAWALVILGISSQVAFSSYLGPEAGAHTIFVPLVGLPLLIFDPRRKISMVIAILLPVASYVLLLATNFSPPGWRWHGAAPGWYSWAVPAATFLVFFLMLYHLFHAQQVAEERLEQEQAKRFAASKLSALGEMAGGVAHEINNPLAAIQLLANQIALQISKQPAGSEAILRAAKNIESTVTRISRITRAMQLLARPSTEATTPVLCGLREILESTAALFTEKLKKEGIAFALAVPESDIVLVCDPAQISHALLNLMNNAYDSVQKTEGARGEKPWIRLEASDLGPSAVISVTNSGAPIAPELRERIFDPFFTTKGIGQGLGLGLSVAQAIAHAHDGRLQLIASSPSTRFELILPKRAIPPSDAGARA
jgi:signal transduction histidine kinase